MIAIYAKTPPQSYQSTRSSGPLSSLDHDARPDDSTPSYMYIHRTVSQLLPATRGSYPPPPPPHLMPVDRETDLNMVCNRFPSVMYSLINNQSKILTHHTYLSET
jgi:hypothetical protein